jgi:hypothetical protein
MDQAGSFEKRKPSRSVSFVRADMTKDRRGDRPEARKEQECDDRIRAGRRRGLIVGKEIKAEVAE